MYYIKVCHSKRILDDSFDVPIQMNVWFIKYGTNAVFSINDRHVVYERGSTTNKYYKH